MLPSDQLIVPSGTTRTDAFLAKCLRSADNSTLVIYLANPTGACNVCSPRVRLFRCRVLSLTK